MSGGHPDFRVHQDGGIQAHVIGIFLHKFFPPGPLYIVLEFHAQGTVVPRVGKAAVDLASGIDEAPAFAESDDLFPWSSVFFIIRHSSFHLR